MIWFKCRFAGFSGSFCSGLGIPDVTVFIAWCKGKTDIVKITHKDDFDHCTNLDNLHIEVIESTSYGSVDGFIAIQHKDTGTYYFASRKFCKLYDFKIAIEITG